MRLGTKSWRRKRWGAKSKARRTKVTRRTKVIAIVQVKRRNRRSWGREGTGEDGRKK